MTSRSPSIDGDSRSRRAVVRDGLAWRSRSWRSPDAHGARPGADAGPAVPGLRPRADLHAGRCRPRRPALARRVPGLPAQLASHEERGGDDRADVPPARRGSRRVPLAGGIPQVVPAEARRRGREARRTEGEAAGAAAPEAGITPEQEQFFEAKIRPVLVDALRQVPREHRREAAGRAPRRQPRGPPQGRRHRPGDRARQARREPADPRDPLPRRRRSRCPPRRSSRTRSSPISRRGSRWARPTRGPGRPAAAARPVGRSREGPGVLVVPAAEEVQPARGEADATGREATSTASSSRRSKPEGSPRSPTPTGRGSSAG